MLGIIGKLPGLVVNVEDSRSEPWSLDVGSNPGFTKTLDEKMDHHLMAEKVTKKSMQPNGASLTKKKKI
jgi:hypothetical protein